MCEIFGISADRKIRANEVLIEFFSHSSEHRDGWGLVTFDDGYPAVEKEPVAAKDSAYLKARLAGELNAAHMAAHIRRATSGTQEYDNTHPFVKRDGSGRAWTLVHNGHIFEAPPLRKYLAEQKGSTDSERILCYIVDEMNRQLEEVAPARITVSRTTEEESERIQLIDRITRELSAGNKLNYILFDGELMYVHTNEPGGLYVKSSGIEPDERLGENASDGSREENQLHSRIFSTKPLTAAGWETISSNRLHVYRDAEEIYTGAPHGNTYVSNIDKEQELYINYSFL